MKRIISILLALILFFTVNTLTIFADDAGEPTILTYINGSSVNGSGTAIARGSVVKHFGTLSGYTGSVTCVDSSYVNVSYPSMKCNYRTFLKTYLESQPVLSVKYDINIPDDTNVNSARTFTPQFSIKDNGFTYGYTTTVAIKYENKTFTMDSATTGFPFSTVKTVDYIPGNWVTVELRAYYGSDGNLICGVYVGGTQIFYGIGSIDYSSAIALENYTFTQGQGVTTYLDEITIATYGESYKPILESKKTITLFDGTLLKDRNGTVYGVNDLPIKPTTKNLSMYSLKDSACIKDLMAMWHKGDGKTASVGTGINNAVENDNSYYVMNWENVQSNYRQNVSEYMIGEAPVLSYSYDVRIPNEDVDMWRMQSIKLTSNPTSETNMSEIRILYDDGNFGISYVSGLDEVNKAPISYTVGSWINFEIRAYLTDENKINVGVYADGNQVYYGEGVKDYTDGLYIYMLRMTSETAVVGEDTVTCGVHYDNIDVSVLPAKYMPKEMLILSLVNDVANNKIEGKATINGNYTTLCLVTAIYNNIGSMEKILIDKTIENGILLNTISGTDYANYIKSGYEVKTFLFDTLQSAIPQIEFKRLTIN